MSSSETLIPEAPSIPEQGEIWFDDGNVVLLVENTAFRVHKGVLKRLSDFFDDVFRLPQPPDQELLNGVPVMHMQDDLDDVLATLKVIYEPFYFDNLPPNAELSTLLIFVSGILRISTKYSMRTLRQKCITILQRRFPSTLASCDELLASKYTYPSAADVIRAIPLAREANVPEILPWAYYIATHVSVESIMGEKSLSWKDKALCLAGKEKLWDAYRLLTHSFLFDVHRVPGCPSNCYARTSHPSNVDWRLVDSVRSSPHPLDIQTKWDSVNVCGHCLKTIEAAHRTGREKVWNLLPSYFGLGSWEEIRKDQAM
ncbi:hypothetical protein AX16_009170 [Volvariella volvacea WC 439]|nr:hypothetical protein AX16_009170 [Volvariella volvacea WC 439]